MKIKESQLDAKLSKLKEILLGCDRLAIAFSGGVDSTFLLLFAREIFGADNRGRLLAVTASAVNFDPDEITYAEELCSEMEIPHKVICLGDDVLQSFSHNPPDRCYICKQNIFKALLSELQTLGFTVLADGTNSDDCRDYRPGQKALRELHIISPLDQAGLTKDEIRLALKNMGIEIWDKPAFACLASRIPYGEKITASKLRMVYEAEKILKELGFRQVRVRCHGDIARIEVPPADMHLFFDEALISRVDSSLKKCGFSYVSLDLGGYVMGNLNKNLDSQ